MKPRIPLLCIAALLWATVATAGEIQPGDPHYPQSQITQAIAETAGQCGPNGCPSGGCPTAPSWQNPGGDLFAGPGKKIAPAYPEPNPAVCRIYVREGRGQSIGSGTLIAKGPDWGVVATASHLFRDARAGQATIEVVFPGDKKYDCKLIVDAGKGSWRVDVAFLHVQERPDVPLVTVAEHVAVGELLTFAGYGSDNRYRTVSGKMTGAVANAQDNENLPYITITGGARQGDSGGPVFNAAGELAGVLWGTDGQSTRATYCGQIDAIAQDEQVVFPWNQDFSGEGSEKDDPAGDRRRRGSPAPTGPLPPAPLDESLSKDIGELQKRLIALDSTVTVLADRFDTELKAVKGVSGLDEKDLAPLREEISAAKEAAGGWMSQYDALEEKLRSEVSGFGKLIDDTKATVSGQFNGFKAEVEQNIGEQIKSAIGEKLSGVKATVEELPWYQRWVVWFVVLVIAMTVFSASGAWALLHRVNKKILAAVPGNRLDDLHARLDDNVERHAAAGWNPLKQAKATAAGGYDAAQEAREIADKAIKAALAAAGLGAALAPGLAPVVSTVERGHEAADDLLDKLMARIATLVDAQPKARPEPAAVAPPAPPRAVAPAAPAAPVPANPAA